MADESKSKEKTLEMRVAELEDKLAKVHITEEEMKAYHKVSALLGGAQSPAAGCVVDCSGCITECMVRPCIIRSCIIRYCNILRACTFECGGGCAPGGGSFGGGFGSLG